METTSGNDLVPPRSDALPAPAPDPDPGRRLRRFFLSGPAGRLEAHLDPGRAGARFAALVCHPHPLGGGTLHNKVVYHAMKTLNRPPFGMPVLRFNFRGVGLSEGEHDGRAEQDDVRTALDWLWAEFRQPILLAGFSFGAWQAARAAANFPNLQALALVGLPSQSAGPNYEYAFLGESNLPKLFLSGDRDPFAPAAELERIAEAAGGAKRIALVAGADHFFTGKLDAMQLALGQWLEDILR